MSLREDIVAKEKVVSLLSLTIKERVVIVAFEALYHISRMTGPLVDLPICLHCVDQVRAAILDGNSITMIMIPRNVTSKVMKTLG